MSIANISRWLVGAFLVTAAATVATAAAGCDDSSATEDGGPDIALVVDFSTSSKDLAASGADLADAGSIDDASPSDGDAAAVDLLTGPDLAGANCIGTGGCYACPPTTNEQFLNQCTTASCSHFDNTRLSLIGDGGVLPPVP